MDEICAVTITASSADWLADLARGMVADRLAACGNVVGPIRSIYRWQGDILDEPEVAVTLHTRQSLVAEIITRVNQEHPYDVPQVVATPIIAANPAYHRWVIDETEAPHD